MFRRFSHCLHRRGLPEKASAQKAPPPILASSRPPAYGLLSARVNRKSGVFPSGISCFPVKNPMPSCDVLIIGGGPAGLRAAQLTSAAGFATIVADRMPSVGRKFLVAGHGGLNLTHSEPVENFPARYGVETARWPRPPTAFP